MSRSCGSVLQAICMLILLTILISGCARIPLRTRSDHLGQPGVLGSCADFFVLLDKQTEHAQVLDPGVFRIKKYPYLRVNRLLASFRDEVVDQTTFTAWVNLLQGIENIEYAEPPLILKAPDLNHSEYFMTVSMESLTIIKVYKI